MHGAREVPVEALVVSSDHGWVEAREVPVDALEARSEPKCALWEGRGHQVVRGAEALPCLSGPDAAAQDRLRSRPGHVTNDSAD